MHWKLGQNRRIIKYIFLRKLRYLCKYRLYLRSMLLEDIFKSNYLKETELSAYNESFIHRITLTVGNEEQFDEIKKEIKGQGPVRRPY